jgi:AraC family transcriptional regulator of adaptative response/methylated-DNA-[protein]-cysteine methyltransferase
MKGGQKFWEAVISRDTRFDGRFVYGVRSTGIYCRQPARHAGPTALRLFFSLRVAAEKAGFRPCRRCRPQDAITAIRASCGGYVPISGNHTQPLKLADLSRNMNVGSSHLQRSFKRVRSVFPRRNMRRHGE